MQHLLNQVSLMLSTVFLVSCASVIPPARIGEYVSSEYQAGGAAVLRIDQQPIQAALVVVVDRVEPSEAPILPEEALARLGESLQRDLGRRVSVAITAVVPAYHLRPQPDGNWTQLTEFGRQRGLEYLALVVVSSIEQEYPLTLFLGWTTHAQPGLRRDNWSLLEFALLDLKRKQILMQAEGRGWATLDRPTTPGITQWYPAIYLRPQDERRIWPPTYEGAPDTLRLVSLEQAAQRLVLKLRNSWLEALESEAIARKSSSRQAVR